MFELIYNDEMREMTKESLMQATIELINAEFNDRKLRMLPEDLSILNNAIVKILPEDIVDINVIPDYEMNTVEIEIKLNRDKENE